MGPSRAEPLICLVKPVSFGGPSLVDGDVGETVGLVQGDQELPGQDEQAPGDLQDLGHLAGVHEEDVGGVALVRVASRLNRS